MTYPYGIKGQELKEYVLAHGAFSPERNLEIYNRWFKGSPRYLFKAADERYHFSKKPFCDAGCSYGMNLIWTCPESYGIEIVPDYVNFAKGLGLQSYERDLVSSDLSDLPKVDALWCCAVLEHVDSPHMMLRRMWTLLNPEGRIFIWVPTIPGFPWRYMRYIPFMRKHMVAHTHSDHINAFTPATIRFMCERAGFDTIEVNAMYPKPFGWLGRFLFVLDGVMYVGKRREATYFGGSWRKGKAAYFDGTSTDPISPQGMSRPATK